MRIVTPEYPWNVTIAEGTNVTLHNGKLYLMFSGSGVGITYTTELSNPKVRSFQWQDAVGYCPRYVE
ncbi:hypothetical protein GCM10007377_11570 [Galliscardovia ingluviei]|uniref:Uncharacterized protein n=1 Tax=Galliscardovia ingluviei TaxID=1769422 RepID=A0A8J3AKP0_9BIFI|nr:hypothetical protein GCM10007377_11570 [Galliscardovia ingluviei]